MAPSTEDPIASGDQRRPLLLSVREVRDRMPFCLCNSQSTFQRRWTVATQDSSLRELRRHKLVGLQLRKESVRSGSAPLSSSDIKYRRREKSNNRQTQKLSPSSAEEPSRSTAFLGDSQSLQMLCREQVWSLYNPLKKRDTGVDWKCQEAFEKLRARLTNERVITTGPPSL